MPCVRRLRVRAIRQTSRPGKSLGGPKSHLVAGTLASWSARSSDTEPPATVPSSLHVDLQAILDTGLENQAAFTDAILTVQLLEST